LDSGANVSILSNLSHLDPNSIPKIRRADKPSGVETANNSTMEIAGEGQFEGLDSVICPNASHNLLSISQYTQETTDTKVLGSVQGTQRSVCALFELLSYVTTLIFSNPQQFSILMYCSLAAVALSGAICVFFALSQQQSFKPQTKSIIEVPLLQE
jgi:hypothetical protein